MQHRSHLPHRSLCSALLAACFIGSAACGSEALSLGSDDAPLEGAEATGCNASGDVYVNTQAELDALAGCRELPGALHVEVPADAPGSLSLEPLAELEAVQGELWLEGPLASLAGLERLEQVGRLDLDQLLVPDLLPLSQLERIVGEPGERAGGEIRLQGCSQLRDLRGLENLDGWASLSIFDVPQLTSLAGLQAPREADSIGIAGAPLLDDISPLTRVRSVTSFSLTFTGLRSFPPMRLDSVQSLSLMNNPALTDLDGLDRLSVVQLLNLDGNDSLRRIELPQLDDFDTLVVLRNAVLESVPFYRSEARNSYWDVQRIGSASRLPRALVEIGQNPSLASITLSTTSFDIEEVVVYENAALTTLDMGPLRRSNMVVIADNAVLASLSMPELEGVDDLTVTNNPALSIAPFASVLSFTREISGNLDEPAP